MRFGERFRDRRHAGRLLAARLSQYAGRPGVFVLGLPRGGIPVAYEVARALRAPLDAFSVRKLGVPGHEELAMGAIGTGGARVLNADIVRAMRISSALVEQVAQREQHELERLELAYREGRPYPDLTASVAVLVDDGIATGATMLAATGAVRARGAERVVAAAPVGPAESCALLRRHADEVVCLITPADFGGVGAWYDDFSPTSDADVRALLSEAVNPT